MMSVLLLCSVSNYPIRLVFFFFFKQKTAYELRISDWSSDVCSSDLHCFQVDQFADDAFRICECLAGLHLTETEAQGLADSLRDLRAFLSGYIKQVFVVVHAGSSSVTVDGTGATASPRRSR